MTPFLCHGIKNKIKNQQWIFTDLTWHKNHHHHHITLVARISLTFSRHSSISFIAPGRPSGQHPVSSHSCWMYIRAGRPAFARPCVGVHKSTSLMSSSLLLQQCPACLDESAITCTTVGSRFTRLSWASTKEQDQVRYKIIQMKRYKWTKLLLCKLSLFHKHIQP